MMMADPSLYAYPLPLAVYKDQDLEPLPEQRNEDGKSYKNPASATLSKSYSLFTDGITNGRRGGFDVHIYYFQGNKTQSEFAKALWERIRREFPELGIYQIWDKPIGPHPVAMFEVDLFTPAQFGAFIPWLVINRGPLSALVHPNTEDEEEEERNHTQRATWLGEALPLDLSIFKMMKRMRQEKAQKTNDSSSSVGG